MERLFLRIVSLVLLILFLGLFKGQAGADQVSILKLSSLIEEALNKNPQIQEALAHWETNKSQVGQVNTLDDPELGVDTWNIPSDLNFSETRNFIFFLRQRFPFPGTLSLREKAAKAWALQAKEEYEATKREIIAQVKIAYNDLFLAHKAIDITEENVEILKRFEQIAQVKYATGAVSQQDVLKAQVELARLSNDLLTLEQELLTARAKLNTLINRPPRSPLGKPEDLDIISIPERKESLEALAIKQRPEIKAVEATILQSQHEIELAKRKNYPDFQLGVKRFQNNGIPQPNGWGVSATINIPWVFHRKHHQRLVETQQKLARQRALKETLENHTRFSVEDLLVKIETAERLANLYQNSVLPQAEQAVKSANIGYRADRVDFLNLLESQRQLEEFKLEFYRALVMQNNGVAQLEQVLGINILDIKNNQNGGPR